MHLMRIIITASCVDCSSPKSADAPTQYLDGKVVLGDMLEDSDVPMTAQLIVVLWRPFQCIIPRMEGIPKKAVSRTPQGNELSIQAHLVGSATTNFYREIILNLHERSCSCCFLVPESGRKSRAYVAPPVVWLTSWCPDSNP